MVLPMRYELQSQNVRFVRTLSPTEAEAYRRAGYAIRPIDGEGSGSSQGVITESTVARLEQRRLLDLGRGRKDRDKGG